MSIPFSLCVSKNFLIKEYSKNRKALRQIAKIISCCPQTISNYLKEYNIKIRIGSEAQKGRHNHKDIKNCPNYIDGRYCESQFCIDCLKKGIKTKISYNNFKYGQKRCKSCAYKLRWQNKIYREKTIRKILKANNRKPNKPEKSLRAILNKLLSREYKFVGDGKVIIDGFCPDFININGQKKIIELYGDYWHKKPELIKRDKRRIKTYRKYGYKTLIIWQKELKNKKILKNRILKFSKN